MVDCAKPGWLLIGARCCRPPELTSVAESRCDRRKCCSLGLCDVVVPPANACCHRRGGDVLLGTTHVGRIQFDVEAFAETSRCVFEVASEILVTQPNIGWIGVERVETSREFGGEALSISRPVLGAAGEDARREAKMSRGSRTRSIVRTSMPASRNGTASTASFSAYQRAS